MASIRRPRADAVRNRALVLAAARVAFEAEGPGVSLDEIARRAGVGPGTLHRHFATKQALLAAVVVDRLQNLAARAGQLAEAEDPGETFFDFLRHLAQEGAHNLVLATALDGELGAEVHQVGAQVTRGLAVLLKRAQRAEVVKPGLTAGSIHAILAGVIEMERRLPARQRGTGFDIVADGLRIPRTPTPGGNHDRSRSD